MMTGAVSLASKSLTRDVPGFERCRRGYSGGFADHFAETSGSRVEWNKWRGEIIRTISCSRWGRS